MIRNRDILNSLPLLASILGNQYGVEVRIGGNNAKTDGKVIYLPSLPMDCDRDLLAMARGFIDHEAAHIRHTDFQTIKAAKMDHVTFTFFNAIEDWRIEKKLAEIFPGCEQNLRWLIRRLFLDEKPKKDTGAGGEPPALFVLDYVLLTVRSWAVADLACKVNMLKEKVERTFPGLVNQLDTILANVKQACPDSESAIAYAHELADCLKRWRKPGQPEMTLESSKQTQNNENSKSDTQGSDTAQEKTETDLDQSGGQSSTQEDPKKPMENRDANETSSSDSCEQSMEGEIAESNIVNDTISKSASNLEHTGADESTAEPTPESNLASLFTLDEKQLPKGMGELIGETLQGNSGEYGEDSITVAVKGHKYVGPLSDQDIQDAMRTSIALRTRMQALLQTQAQRLCQPARRGKLNPTSLYRLNVGNPRIFRKTSEQRGLDTAIHILLDASGSMFGKPIHLASLACYSVAKAFENCRRISIGITVFPGSYPSRVAVYPLLEHGAKVTNMFDVGATGDTPLAESLWWVMQNLVLRKESRKILLILTDGRPQNRATAEKALQEAMRIGIEPYGIGIMDNNIAALLPGRSQIIKSLAELVPAMFAMLGKCLLKDMRGGNEKTD